MSEAKSLDSAAWYQLKWPWPFEVTGMVTFFLSVKTIQNTLQHAGLIKLVPMLYCMIGISREMSWCDFCAKKKKKKKISKVDVAVVVWKPLFCLHLHFKPQFYRKSSGFNPCSLTKLSLDPDQIWDAVWTCWYDETLLAKFYMINVQDSICDLWRESVVLMSIQISL